MNHKLDSDYSINRYDMLIIDSYSFHCLIVSIVKVAYIKEFEYRVQYDPSTHNHLKNFNRYEKEIKLFLQKL